MTSHRASYWALGGLVALMTGLFGTAFYFNRQAYVRSMETVELSFTRTLDQQKELLLQRLETEEERLFALVNTDRMLEIDLFIDMKSGFLPGYTTYLLPGSLPEEEAMSAFRKGVERLPDPAAADFFETAAKIRVETEEGLYLKASALFNLLDERGADQRLICRILKLLEWKSLLPDARQVFFRSLLEERVARLEEIEERINILDKTAGALSKSFNHVKGGQRVLFDDRVFSVRQDGFAILYSPDMRTLPNINIGSEPTGFHRQVIPGLYISTGTDALVREKRRIQQQYRVNNAALVVLGSAGLALSSGVAANARRQRRLDTLRTKFIATVSHELRTPLALIRLHAETLHHGRISEEKIADYHQTILTESERLTGIVNNVLDFSRMERGKMDLNIEAVNLSDCTARAVDSFRYRFDKEGFEVERNIARQITAMADPLAWSQILFNLLDNAVKYSDDMKKIKIELETSGAHVCLRISDNGIGIPAVLRKTIFEDFVRSGDSKVTARRGSGIGLSVARKLTEKMGGTIGVADNQPNGTVFTVKLDNCDEIAGG